MRSRSTDDEESRHQKALRRAKATFGAVFWQAALGRRPLTWLGTDSAPRAAFKEPEAYFDADSDRNRSPAGRVETSRYALSQGLARPVRKTEASTR